MEPGSNKAWRGAGGGGEVLGSETLPFRGVTPNPKSASRDTTASLGGCVGAGRRQGGGLTAEGLEQRRKAGVAHLITVLAQPGGQGVPRQAVTVPVQAVPGGT